MAGSWYCLVAFSLAICLPAIFCKEKISQGNVKKIALANNYMAVNIYKELSSKSSENIFFSPLSLSTILGMLYYGAKGRTAEELRNTLSYGKVGLSRRRAHKTFRKYLRESLRSRDPSAYILKAANFILLDKKLNMVSSYRRKVRRIYNARVKRVNFKTENNKILKKANKWIKDKTNGKIENMLDELDPSTKVLLLNALYFKGIWNSPFESGETKPEIFYNDGLESKAKKVPMMRTTDYFPYTVTDDAQVIEMPYKGEEISMYIILPIKLKGLKALESRLYLEKLRAIKNNLRPMNIYLILPKFKMEYKKDMSGDFASLGANSIFTTGADFSGMTSSKNVFVKQLLHKAVIEVNEEGSEAAAVSSAVMVPVSAGSPSIQVEVNHPFLFFIVDKRNSVILFVGRVTRL